MEQLRPLLPYIRRYRNRYLGGSIAMIFATLAAALMPQIVGHAVDDLNRAGIDLNLLLIYGGVLLAAALAEGVLRYIQRIYFLGTSHLIDYDLRSALFSKLLSLDQGFYSTMHTGDLMARVTNDLSAVRQFLGPGVNITTSSVLLIIVSAILMAFTNLTLTLVVIFLLPIITLIFNLFGRRMRPIFQRVQDQFGHISTRAQENFSGIRTIKAYAQEDAEIKVFLDENQKYRALGIRYVTLSGLLWPVLALLLGMVAALVLLIGGQFVAAGQLTVGQLVLFNAYLGMLSWPVIGLGWSVDLYQQAIASTSRIAEVLHRRPQIATSPEAHADYAVQGEIEFRNVGIRFRYDLVELPAKEAVAPQPANGTPTVPVDHFDRTEQPREEWVLRNISFKVPAGTSLAIVGSTGVGKTTLINLLARVRDPDEGQVLVDGHDVRELPLDKLRHGIGYVPQDTFLFSIPLRENVTFGRPEADDADVDRAMTISRLSNDLPQIPDGLDAVIGERGVTLSGGQKQRTAIARAVLRDPAVLVLDDALSSVDTHTAAEILEGLRSVMQGRTSIIIAQRVATVKDADQILVLRYGQITERGVHRDLVAQGGYYAEMYRRELLRSELEEDA